MAKLESLELQQAFADYARSGDRALLPKGLDPRRSEIYSGLVFNNLERLVSRGLPRMKKQIGAVKWERLIREFMTSDSASTPYFYEISGQFLQWYGARRENDEKFPMICQLGHYEWVVTALDILNDIDQPLPLSWKNLMEQPYSWANDATVVQYDWSMHSKQIEVSKRQQTRLLLWRKKNPWQVRWRELTPLQFELYQMIQQSSGQSIMDVWASFRSHAQSMQSSDDAVIKESIIQGWVNSLVDLQILRQVL